MTDPAENTLDPCQYYLGSLDFAPGLSELYDPPSLCYDQELTSSNTYAEFAQDFSNNKVLECPTQYYNEFSLLQTREEEAQSQNPQLYQNTQTNGPRKRKSEDQTPIKKEKKQSRTHTDKCKGLRHFSLKVCEKVERMKFTSYNQVADELVEEFCSPNKSKTSVDQKNIRRRVYDALNVLRAMDIISKEKKVIRWIGLPYKNQTDCEALECDRAQRLERLQRKNDNYTELLSHFNGYRNLINRNASREVTSQQLLHLPFLIVNTRRHTRIDCYMNKDQTEYNFDFSQPFEINEDSHFLSLLGLCNSPSKSTTELAEILPPYQPQLNTADFLKHSNGTEAEIEPELNGRRTFISPPSTPPYSRNRSTTKVARSLE
eukprot:TRINITY_DN16761_c0_g1_i1.p1 TRINITY_DN16761_c0_g1~~TRINITY_DN16761_c0_g1_i1.p1  ORF type:complete len:374 (+),score=70.34 TRINITY_DN16761_c0_g1_i1:21-1142(+)